MNLDDQLRSAADDVRSELASTQPPAFEPPTPTGSRVALLAMVALVVGGGWWLSRPADETEPMVDATVEVADDAPDAEESGPVSAVPTESSRGVTGVEAFDTSSMAQPTLDPYSIEPDTGVAIRRVTTSESGSVAQPVYSATQTYNADGSLILLYRTGDDQAEKGHVVLDANTGELVRVLDLEGRSDIENTSWDPLDSDTLIFQRGTELVDINARTGEIDNTVDFPACASIGNGSSAGSTMSHTGVIGFLCERSDGTSQWMAYDRVTMRTIAGGSASVEAAPTPSISAEFFVVAGPEELLVFDADLNLTRSVGIEISSLSVAQDRSGNDLAVATVFEGPTEVGTVLTVDLASGAVDVIVGPTTGYPYPPSGTQLSTAATDAPHLLAISTNTEHDDVLANEIMLLDLDGAASTLSRLAHHRNDGLPVAGWASTTMVAVNPDGDRVLFSSNWGSDAIDTYEIVLP